MPRRMRRNRQTAPTGFSPDQVSALKVLLRGAFGVAFPPLQEVAGHYRRLRLAAAKERAPSVRNNCRVAARLIGAGDRYLALLEGLPPEVRDDLASLVWNRSDLRPPGCCTCRFQQAKTLGAMIAAGDAHLAHLITATQELIRISRCLDVAPPSGQPGPETTFRPHLGRDVVRILHEAELPCAKSRDGLLARVLALVMEAAGMRVPEDMFPVVKEALGMYTLDDRTLDRLAKPYERHFRLVEDLLRS
jgi:hypothetical protein